jgi:WD40 repeat protein
LVLKPVAQVGGLAFSPDRKLLAGAAFDDTLRIWGVETGKELGLVKDIEKLVAVDFPSPDCIVTRGAGKPPAFWDVSKIRVPVLQKQQPDLGKRCDLHAFSTDGKRLATVTFEAGGRSARGTVKIWGAPEWNEIRELERTKGQPMTLAFSKDGKTLALGSAFGPDDPIQLWDVETGKTIATFADQVPHTLAFSPDGKYLAGGDYGGGLLLWDLTKKEKVMSMAAHTKAIVGLLFTPDGRHLISGSYDSTVQVWDFAKLLKKSP